MAMQWGKGGKTVQAEIDAKRRELAEVQQAAEAERQAAIVAENELKTVLDEQVAITAVARARVATNKAGVLIDKAALLEAEIAQLERRALEEEAAATQARLDAEMKILVSQLWAAHDAAKSTARAERDALLAQSKIDGESPHAATALSVADTIGDLLVRARVAVWTVEGLTFERNLKAV
jgi:hypothetical protein